MMYPNSEGFWREFFLLRPNQTALQKILNEQSPDDLLNYSHGRQLFAQSISCLRNNPRADADIHALDTLTTFFLYVLTKRYTNPSFDIINVLVGLEEVDVILSDFVETLDSVIGNGRSLEVRMKAVRAALAMISGAYQTTILTYFLQRNLFLALVKLIQDCDGLTGAGDAFALLGLLSNYNKFEFQNPYQLRIGSFVNEKAIKVIVTAIGEACQEMRAEYLHVQDDTPEGWTLSSALGMVGLSSIASGPKALPRIVQDEEAAKQLFSTLPSPRAAVLLPTFDFAHMNKLFCVEFVATSKDKSQESPFAAYISLTSYIVQHAHLSIRATHYARVNLMVFRLLIEDTALCTALCSTSSLPIRICRQRQPHLPSVKTDRPLVCALLDLMVDSVNHNLKRRLDVSLYSICVGTLLRIASFLAKTRIRLQYHWAELWRSLLGLIRFLNSYAKDIASLDQIETLLDLVVNLIAFSLSAGEAFLPGPAAYDDLFYKIVETHDILLGFQEAYSLSRRPSNSIDILLGVGEHYHRILNESGKKTLGRLDAFQMADVIKKGYETLSIQTKEDLDSWETFREADERVLLKKVARETVADVKLFLDR